MSDLGIFYPTIPSGGGDFSTAEVTIQRGENSVETLGGAFVIEEANLISYTCDFVNGDSRPNVLYKGKTVANVSQGTPVVISGNATIDFNDIIITGDCVLTIDHGGLE